MKCCIQLYLNHVYPKLDTLVGGTTPPLNRLVAARLVTAVTPSPDNESPRVCCSSKLMNHWEAYVVIIISWAYWGDSDVTTHHSTCTYDADKNLRTMCNLFGKSGHCLIKWKKKRTYIFMTDTDMSNSFPSREKWGKHWHVASLKHWMNETCINKIFKSLIRGRKYCDTIFLFIWCSNSWVTWKIMP